MALLLYALATYSIQTILPEHFSHRFEIVVRRRVNKPLAERKKKRFSMLDAYSPIAKYK